MSKQSIIVMFSVLILVALGIAFYLYKQNSAIAPEEYVPPNPELKSKEEILLELNSFKVPEENQKSEKEILNDLNSFKPSTKNTKSEEQILQELNGAPAPSGQ